MRAEVQRYYGETLQSTTDLRTTACSTPDAPPAYLKAALGNVHEEVLDRYYGCGLVLPEALDGAHILDLGCGAGRDCYVLAQLVGEQGRVTGVDMTPEQLAVARRHQDFHTRRFGYRQSNVDFVEGDIERLADLGLPNESVDLIVSNCVINLASDKRAVLEQAWRLLRPGGELYFADIYADRRIPPELRSDPVLYGECLSGALYWNDFLRLARLSGFLDPRLVDSRMVAVTDSQLVARLGDIRFVSATYRLFKLPGLEAACEDYGQAVCYRGTVPHFSAALSLDRGHRFETGRETPVCGNSYRMVAESRFAEHFDFPARARAHRGLFAGCGTADPYVGAGAAVAGDCC
ncbi:MAG: methyltransferase domain-containing protein [Gammaproteobacteria bacterium]|nr:methyltransferase domain-containing protein [Gammaproteobacteria bacterium]